MYNSDNYLLQLNDNEALSLSRTLRRRRDKLLSKHKKNSNISKANNETDTITISKAELRRLIDDNIQQHLKSIEECRQEHYNKITVDIITILIYFLHKECGYGHKRLTNFVNRFFETFYFASINDNIKLVRKELFEKFHLDLYQEIFDIDNNLIETLDMNMSENYKRFMDY